MFSRLALAALLLLAPLAAQENLFIHVPDPDPRSETRVEVTALFSKAAPDGFLPLRVTVVNKTRNDATLHFACKSVDSGYSDRGETSSSFTLTAPAEKTTIHDQLVPLTAMLTDHHWGSGMFTIRMTGGLGEASGSLSSSYSGGQPAVLLSEPLFTPNASSLDAAISTVSSSRHGGSTTFAGKFNPREMPEDWRAYSGYDAIAMTDADWGLLTPGARNAILQWNRLGGHVVIYSTNTSADLATLGISTDATGIRNATRTSGRFEIVPLGGGMGLDSGSTLALFTSSPSLNTGIREDFSSRGWPLQGRFGEQSFNYALFIFVLIAFGILVGPVNLFVFAKSGRRHRLFVTTPLIALGASALLIVLIILQDGFGGRGMRIALVEVRPDNNENAAYVTQEQISRTGVLLGRRFEIAESAAISPLPLSPSRWARLTNSNDGGGMVYETNLADGKTRLTGDWFQSRSEQGQLIRAVVPTRGRIESRNQSGAPSFLSTFEFPLESLWFTDESGGVWVAENIQPGKSFTCRQAATGDFDAFVTDERNKLSERPRKSFSALSTRRSHFIAITTAAPGIDTFKAIDWKETRTILTGPIFAP